MNPAGRDRVQWQVPHLAALAVHLQVLDPTFLNVAHLQQRRLLTAQSVIEKHSQYRPVALPFKCCFIRRLEQRLRLVVTQRRRLAFVAFYPGTFTPCTGLPPAIALFSRK